MLLSATFETFSYLNEDYVPGATRVKQYDNEVEFCPICEIVLLEDDYIVTNKEDFLEEAIEFLAQKSTIISKNVSIAMELLSLTNNSMGIL
ncbi:dual specificity protein phosphatase family protein (plasmid) [Bacillus megaterium]|nr:dual specificity protein phosphatase family protein [Priestia megaterium]